MDDTNKTQLHQYKVTLGHVEVTVTGVDTSPDLRRARVHVSVLGDEDARAASLDGLRSAHGVLQRRVADELRLKHTPTLEFAYDDTAEKGVRLTKLIDEASGEG